jgi:hypothetical protein
VDRPGGDGDEGPLGKPCGKGSKEGPDGKPNRAGKEGAKPGEGGPGPLAGDKGPVAADAPGTAGTGPGGQLRAPGGASGTGETLGPGPSKKPPAKVMSQLFQPGGQGRPADRTPEGSERKRGKEENSGPAPAALKPWSGKVEDIADPAERAAVERLEQAVRRIQANRDLHRPGGAAGPGGGSVPVRRRDW